MPIRTKTWTFFLCLAVMGAILWFYYSYPRFAFLQLNVSHKEATTIAKKFLQDFAHTNPDEYHMATVFATNNSADRYLQKTLGIQGEQRFLKKYNFDLFVWIVRFFKENQKEEYRLSISAISGKIVGYRHEIPETAARPEVDRKEAKKEAMAFLQNHFSYNLSQYHIKGEFSTIYDNRTDHAFSWWHNDVYIPWSKDPDGGGARLLTSARVSGHEILSFSKNHLDIPEKFERSLDKDTVIGRILSSIFRVFLIIIVVGAVYVVVAYRHHLAMHIIKPFIVKISIAIFFSNILVAINQIEHVFFNMKTTTSFISQWGQYAVNLLLESFYISVGILITGLAAEALYATYFRKHPKGSFLHYVTSTFFSRNVSKAILLGYLFAISLLGMQSLLFHIGQKYLGVWTNYAWVTQMGSSYLPFLTVLVLSFQASFFEEITYRIFAISWARLLLKRLPLAILLASIVWGIGHTNYAIFPTWFRGLEVSILGIFFGLVYLYYGIIPVLVAHFSFDAFWASIGLLLGKPFSPEALSCLGIILLPLLFALVAFVRNKPEIEQKRFWQLNPHQLFNVRILCDYLKNEGLLKTRNMDSLKKELLDHYWDGAVIDESFRRLMEEDDKN